MPEISRRDCLKLASQGLLALSGLFGLGMLFRFLDYQAGPTPPTDFDLGPASNYAPGSRTLRPEIPAIVIRTCILQFHECSLHQVTAGEHLTSVDAGE